MTKTITYDETKYKLVPIDLLKDTIDTIADYLSGVDFSSYDRKTLGKLKAINAAPAAEEAPQREHHDINKIAEALRRVGLTLLQTANGYHVMKLGEVTAQAQQQPATHGEPVAWMCSDAALVRMGYSKFSKDCSGAWNTPVYTAPQPTPELVQAAKLALNALNPRPGMPNPEYESLVACAIDALQNALKGST